MIPVGDVIPRRTAPVVTVLLVAFTGLVFAGEWLLPERRLREIISGHGLVPVAFSWPSLVTSIFLHRGLLEAASNLAALWIFGASVEDRMGRARFLLFYLLGGSTAGLADVVARGDSPWPAVGAGGAVAAVIGAHFVLFPRSRTLLLIPVPWKPDVIDVPSLLTVGFWLLFQIGSGASLFPPLGGALAGVLLVWVFRRRERETVQWWS